MASLQTHRIPVIDIGPSFDEPAGKRRVAVELRHACEEMGFFCIVGHRFPEDVLQRTYDVGWQFFDLPLKEKMKVARPAAAEEGPGYLPMKSETLAASLGARTPADLKEVINFSVESGRNLWPAKPDGLKTTFMEYIESARTLAAHLMTVCAVALDLPERFFEGKFDRGFSLLRLLNYPDQESEPLPGQLRAGAHTDYGALTILLAEEKPGGLQALAKTGDWIHVPTIAGGFVINIGDMLARWTNDRWVSTMHRVVNPPPERKTGTRRQSIVFFYQPNLDAVIECLDTCFGPENPARYAPFVAGEWMRGKVKKSAARDLDPAPSRY